MRRVRPAASCNGFNTGIAAMVVQFGFAIMPFGAVRAASGFTSLTTSGTSGSIRNADELSITVTPAAANRGANSRDDDAPAENRAMSRPDGSAVEASSTVMSEPLNATVVPAERADANMRISSMGKPRSTNSVRITPPTWPVAPTIPTRMPAG